jgi:PhnB protein
MRAPFKREPAMPNPTNSVTPYLHYADLERAMEWLTKAFGFRELTRLNGPDQKPRHAEMGLGESGVVMVGWPGAGYRTPKQLGQVTCNVYVRIDEGIDALFEQATQAGATVLEKPADQAYGERRCGLEDPEGHRWYFGQPLSPRGQAALDSESAL